LSDRAHSNLEPHNATVQLFDCILVVLLFPALRPETPLLLIHLLVLLIHHTLVHPSHALRPRQPLEVACHSLLTKSRELGVVIPLVHTKSRSVSAVVTFLSFSLLLLPHPFYLLFALL
jgi:hypothetical protein